MSERSLQLFCYVVFLFLTFLFIGSSLVTIAWIAVEDSSIAVVGRIFLLSSLTGIGISLLGGVLTDSWNRKMVIRLGITAQVIALVILLYAILEGHSLPPFLYIFSVLNTAGMAVKAGAIDSVFQAIVSKERRVAMSVRVSIIRQLGLAIGMGGGGILLDQTSAIFCISLLLVVSISRFAISEVFLNSLKKIKRSSSSNPMQLWKEGLAYAANDKNIYLSICGVALTFSAAQMTNVLVPGFVQDELAAGSDVYGLLEMAWAIGGGTILLIAAFKHHSSPYSKVEALLLCLLGISMMLFSFLRFIPALILLYAIMGGLFSITRARFDGKILTFCPEGMMGRVRATTSMLTNSIGMVIYLIPTLFSITSVSGLYMAWGAFILCVGLLIWLFQASSIGSKRRSTET
ncbi:Major Facilitator Superfamily protein [Franzmannia pantelleriensis]|uniref:Major Facilitator Superfamily protein n=2 Tax=Franzmannia pantelleriensis TaxID=48727 RepID=A0A1G9P827_9GAMM|nr:Major Facilitator Superfamily protein [Halomonas pantelleriensis]